MLAVLPKRNQDEISGELFVAAYVKKLGSYSDSQISFLADKALERCQWFPTIAECMEIMADWRRDDESVHRKWQARALVNKEKHARDDEDRQKRRDAAHKEIMGTARNGFCYAASVDAIRWWPQEAIDLGLNCGTLIRDDLGRIKPAPYNPGPQTEIDPDSDLPF